MYNKIDLSRHRVRYIVLDTTDPSSTLTTRDNPWYEFGIFNTIYIVMTNCNSYLRWCIMNKKKCISLK